MKRKKILILTANPTNTQPLRLSEEVREIKSAWERSLRREEFEIIVEEAVRPKELRRALLTHKPQIIHFSGHGDGEQGLILMGDYGKGVFVTPDALSRFFKAIKDIFMIETVLFNACYSEVQADSIYPYINYIIGMKKAIGDAAAIQFSIGFYDTLFNGESIENAFALGCNAIELENISEHLTPIIRKNHLISNPITPQSQTSVIFDNIDGQVPLNSSFYIERPEVENKCYESIVQPGALIRIKAPRKMGKTSLMSRILSHGKKQGYHTALMNLWSKENLTDINTFLQGFCAIVSEELGVEEQIDKYWTKRLSSQINCTNYFKKYLLKAIETPLVLGLDDIDQIFPYTLIAQEFFALLRAWHENGKNEEIWQKLRLVIAHSQEVYVSLKFNQSPFNVGLSIDVGEFNATQVQELIQRHGLNFSEVEREQLRGMVDGHPYLLRTALYQIAKGNLCLEQFLQVAPTDEGLFGDFLYHYLLLLEDDRLLKMAMQEVINSDVPVKLDSVQAFKLRSMGLIEFKGNEVQSLCNLYRLYFRGHLSD
ncbi:AAA-like domain-containing protein [Calothrix sp. 336/3]|uniref:AAA-like domain-containing protein n=1 Tax=Calothrix sp. 336/3 TaxID=1337936 RepID=UPI0004E294AE|nr:AAA-like domain-containing protein [Calothrix sp. 336/3]AKG23387.1 adenylate cyclase [Calothrix sp. 336/3]